MRTETLAIVFTDIKGYTATTSAQTHKENARMLRRIDRLVAPVVRAYSGRVVKSIGDAYMIVFRSPTEAVRCATAIQDRVYQHNAASRPDQSIHIRVAASIGEVRVHRGDVFGDPVNVAARIESITPADEVYFSEAIYLTMNRSQLASERVGEFELKGIPEPITVFRAKKFVATAGTSREHEQRSASLPYGGTELGHWRRMRWLRRAYVGSWAVVLAGLVGAAYLRYRPTADYTDVLTAIKAAVEGAKPVDAIALAGQIPPTAIQERSLARRYRRQAVMQLLEGGDVEMARAELGALIGEDSRDAEALLLQGTLLARRGKDARAAVTAVASALRINPSLAGRPEVLAVVIQGYRDAAARRTSEHVVDNYLKHTAIPGLAAALNDGSFDLRARTAIGLRLEKLGAGQEVDWVALALEELKNPSCKARKNAIVRLVNESDERAVGPLMKIADANGCGSAEARRAIASILGK